MNFNKSNVLNKTIKPKVLLRSMGVRRDAGYCLVLKAMLEHYGYKVFISCTRNFDFALKFWKPDIVILSNFFGAEKVKILSPHSFMIYLEGEGFNLYDSYMADYCFENRNILKLYDLILLWGNVHVDSFKKYKNKIMIPDSMQILAASILLFIPPEPILSPGEDAYEVISSSIFSTFFIIFEFVFLLGSDV